MFDIGGVELMVIAAVAILVVGPRELPGMLRGIGRFVKQARQMTSSVQRQFNDALKEAELDEVKKTIDDVRSLNPATQIKKTIAKEMRPLTDVGDSVKEAVGEVDTVGRSKSSSTLTSVASQRAQSAPPASEPAATAEQAQAAPSGKSDG